MASNMAKVPLMRTLVCRGFASAVAKPAESASVETSVLPNGLQVATIQKDVPLLRVCVAVKAGSRYESPENAGATHMIRSSVGLTTKGASIFAITRTIQERTSTLCAVGDRDTILYTVECPNEEAEFCLRILKCVTTEQEFRPWELVDNMPRLKYELNQVAPQARVVDMLHGAAYQSGLGNSIFLPKYMIGHHGPENLLHYVKNTHLGRRTAVSAIGAHSHRAIAEFASTLNLPDKEGLPTSSTYFGGELRKRGHGLAHIAIATEGAGINKKEVLAFSILQHALGNGIPMKWGNGVSVLTKAAEAAAGNGEPVAIAALNAAHQDSGLFGAVITCEPAVAGKVVEAAVKVLKTGSVSEELIKRGKAGAKASILMAAENSTRLAEDMAQQAVLLGAVQSPLAIASAIDAVSSSDVNNVARKVASGKLSIAALGDIGHVPHVNMLN